MSSVRRRRSVVGEIVIPYLGGIAVGLGFGGYSFFAGGVPLIGWLLWVVGAVLAVSVALRSRRIQIVEDAGSLTVANMWREVTIRPGVIRRVGCSGQHPRSRIPVVETDNGRIRVHAGYRPKGRTEIFNSLSRAAHASGAPVDLRLTDLIRGTRHWRPPYPE
jgi:hypothetical protein